MKAAAKQICFFFIVVTSFLSFRINAASQDSLLNELNKAKNDTGRINILLQLHKSAKDNPDSALAFVNKAIVLAEETHADRWIFETQNALAKWYYSRLKYDSTLAVEKRLLSLKQNTKYVLGQALSYRLMGNAFTHQSLDSSLFYYQKSLSLFKSLNNLEEYYSTEGNLAVVYSRSGKLEEAVQISERLIEYYHQSGNKNDEAKNQMNCAIFYEGLGDLKKAESYLNQSLQTRKELNDEFGVGYVSYNLGGLYAQTGIFSEAKKAYLFTLNVGEKITNNELIYLSSGGLANLANTTGQWDEAILFASKAWEAGPKNKQSEADIQMLMSNAYDNKKDFKKALEHYRTHIAARDSFLDAQRLQHMDDLEAVYQNKEKQAQINHLNIEKQSHEKQKRLSFWIAGLAVLLLGVGFFSFRQRQKLKLRLERQEAIMDERQRISRELHDDLGAQLSTAKMFLNSMKNYPDLNNNHAMLETSLNLIDSTINDLKKIMEDLQSSVLQEKGYIAATEELVSKINQLQQVSFSLTYHNPEKRLDRKTEHHLFRITQELINNSLKYAKAKNVSINLVKHENKIVLMYEDNGTGFNIEEVKKGNGLLNIEARCNAMGGKVEFDSEPGAGSRAIVEMPFAYAS